MARLGKHIFLIDIDGLDVGADFSHSTRHNYKEMS